MRCDEYRTAWLDGDRGPEVEGHRARCPACAASEDELGRVDRLLAAGATWAEPPANLEHRVQAAIAGVRHVGHVAAVPDPANGSGFDGPDGIVDPAAPPETKPVSEPSVLLRPATAPPRPSRRRWLAWVAAAAVAAAVSVSIMSSTGPDWEVALAGEGPTPQATATVAGWATDAGTRMRIDAVDLPAAPDGYVYELWLSNGDVHLSAGSFRAASGIELWIGVSRRDFPRVWVTLEAVDADTSLNGETVLDDINF